MNIEQIKTYIMAVLISKKDKLAISPDLTIDRLFDGLDHEILPEIVSYVNWGSDQTHMQMVWDRYLMPRLAQADMFVKVFAR